jgi:GTP-binding protein
MVEAMPKEAVSLAGPRVFRPTEDEDTFEIVKEGERFRLRGRRLQRAAAMTDWYNEEAVTRFQRILKAMGIVEALKGAGIKAGDTVVIDDYEWEWE